MHLNRTLYLTFWLIFIPLLVAGGTYSFTSPKTPVYQANTIYTVVPQNELAPDNYSNLQATNLFMDVIKSWLSSGNLQAEMQAKLAAANFMDLRALSMQTFEMTVTASNQDQAIIGANLVREIIYRETGRYAASGDPGYVIYNFDPTIKQVFPQTYANTGLGLMIGLILGGFAVLVGRYYLRS